MEKQMDNDMEARIFSSGLYRLGLPIIRGTTLVIARMRVMVRWALYWGPIILRNYYLGRLKELLRLPGGWMFWPFRTSEDLFQFAACNRGLGRLL